MGTVRGVCVSALLTLAVLPGCLARRDVPVDSLTAELLGSGDDLLRLEGLLRGSDDIAPSPDALDALHRLASNPSVRPELRALARLGTSPNVIALLQDPTEGPLSRAAALTALCLSDDVRVSDEELGVALAALLTADLDETSRFAALASIVYCGEQGTGETRRNLVHATLRDIIRSPSTAPSLRRYAFALYTQGVQEGPGVDEPEPWVGELALQWALGADLQDKALGLAFYAERVNAPPAVQLEARALVLASGSPLSLWLPSVSALTRPLDVAVASRIMDHLEAVHDRTLQLSDEALDELVEALVTAEPTPELAERGLDLLLDARGTALLEQNRGPELAAWTGRSHVASDLLEAKRARIEQHLHASVNANPGMHLITEAFQSPKLAATAAGWMCEAIAGGLEQPGSHPWWSASLVRLVADASPEHAACDEAIRGIVGADRVPAWVRGTALLRYARTRRPRIGEEALDRYLQRSSDPGLRAAALLYAKAVHSEWQLVRHVAIDMATAKDASAIERLAAVQVLVEIPASELREADRVALGAMGVGLLVDDPAWTRGTRREAAGQAPGDLDSWLTHIDGNSADTSAEQSAAVAALVHLGADARSAIDPLAAELERQANIDEPDVDDGRKSKILRLAKATVALAKTLDSADDVRALPALRRAVATLERANLAEDATEVARAVQHLEALWFRRKAEELEGWVRTNPTLALSLAYVPTTLALSFLLLLVSPGTIWRVSSAIGTVPLLSERVAIPWLKDATVSLSDALVLPWFRHHRRVLEYWVRHHGHAALDHFRERTAVRERSIYVPVPVVIAGRPRMEGQNATLLTHERIRELTAHDRYALSIEGEGGVGKSTLAFELLRTLVTDGSGQPAALPVMIDRSVFPEAVDDPAATFVDHIADELTALCKLQRRLDPDMVRRLIATQRVVVVVDRISELDRPTQATIREAIVHVPASAVVMTSRIVQPEGALTLVRIRPQRIEGNAVSAFLDGLLRHRGLRDTIDDATFFGWCSQLSTIAQHRDVTPLLATLFVDFVSTGGTSSVTGVGAAALIDAYVARILQPLESRVAGDLAFGVLRNVAWSCLMRGRPGTAAREVVLAQLKDGGVSDHERVLDAIVSGSTLLERVGPQGTDLRFVLDPVAEYLGTAHALDRISRAGAKEQLHSQRLLELVAQADASYARTLLDCLERQSGLPDEVSKPLRDLALEVVSRQRSVRPA